MDPERYLASFSRGLAWVAGGIGAGGLLLWALLFAAATSASHELARASTGLALVSLLPLVGLGSLLFAGCAVSQWSSLGGRHRAMALVGLLFPASFALWLAWLETWGRV
mgnify:CR=1 FL=1